MKTTYKKSTNSALKVIVFLMSFCLSSTVVNNIPTSSSASQTATRTSSISSQKSFAFISINKNIKQNPDLSILSKDYWTAKQSLDKAITERNLATLRLGLKNKILNLRTMAVQSIKLFDDRSSIPDLIKALQDNQGCMSGGTEIQVMQIKLNEEIISALKQFTGLDFPYLKKSSMVSCESITWELTDIEKVLIESRRWWNMHQRINNFQDL